LKETRVFGFARDGASFNSDAQRTSVKTLAVDEGAQIMPIATSIRAVSAAQPWPAWRHERSRFAIAQ